MNQSLKEIKQLLVLIVLFIGLFSASSASAASLLWFGGKYIASVMPCTCSGGFHVIIANEGHNAIFNGSYLYLPGETQTARGGIGLGVKAHVLVGRSIIGLYSPGGICTVGVPPYCTTLPITRGTMTWIATN